MSRGSDEPPGGGEIRAGERADDLHAFAFAETDVADLAWDQVLDNCDFPGSLERLAEKR